MACRSTQDVGKGVHFPEPEGNILLTPDLTPVSVQTCGQGLWGTDIPVGALFSVAPQGWSTAPSLGMGTAQGSGTSGSATHGKGHTPDNLRL